MASFKRKNKKLKYNWKDEAMDKNMEFYLSIRILSEDYNYNSKCIMVYHIYKFLKNYHLKNSFILKNKYNMHSLKFKKKVQKGHIIPTPVLYIVPLPLR